MACFRQNVCVLAAIVLQLAVVLSAAKAEEVATDPVGFSQVDLAGNSDTYLYIPFKRTPVLGATVAAISQNGQYDEKEPYVDANGNGRHDESETFTDTFNELTFTEDPGLQEGQLVYSQGTQPSRYYVSMRNGDLPALSYPVVSNSATTVVIDALGADFSQVTEQFGMEVIPYDTLGSIFPAGQGVHASTSHSAAVRRTWVFLPNHEMAGKNIAFDQIYYYYSGTNPGWRKSGAPTVLANDAVLPPGSYFIVRHKDPAGTTLVFTGNVHMAKFATPLNTLAANMDQDNFVAAPIPVEMRLRDLNLIESGAFAPSSSHSAGVRQDILFMWDNTTLGINRASDAIYYYYNGASAPGPGWRKSGAPAVLADDDVVMSPSRVFMIRKKATPVPSSSLWSISPSYVPSENP